MTDEQIAALDDEAAKARAAELSGYTWDVSLPTGWYALGAIGHGWVVEGDVDGFTVFDGASSIVEEGRGSQGDASRAFLRHYHAGRISLPGRPAWAPVLEKLRSAGFATARLMTVDGVRVVDMGEAFRIAMGVGND